MERRNFMLFAIILKVLILNGQSKIDRMYLLMSSSTDHISHWDSKALNPITTDTTKPAVLYMLDRGGIKSIDTINFDQKKGSIMPECRHFDEFKYFYIREKGFKGSWVSDKSGTYYDTYSEGNFVSVLDYSGDTIVLRKANADSIAQSCNLLGGKTYFLNNELYYSFSQCEYQVNYHRNVIDKYFNIIALGEQEFIYNQYQRSESNSFYRMSSEAGFPFNKKRRLVLNIDSRINKEDWKEVYFQFPYKVDIKKYFSILYLLKTEKANKEVLYKILYSGSTDSITTYYIHDKITKRLDSMNTHFNILGMNLYKNYLGFGTLILNSKYSKNKTKDMPAISRYSNKYGPIPNLQYNTGKFFIWDLNKNDFRTYSFDDNDTELLSIHEDWVYYRIYDEIRRIKLSDLNTKNYKQKTELLYKDKERVPHIHHVFWAPEMRFKVEYVKPSKK